MDDSYKKEWERARKVNDTGYSPPIEIYRRKGMFTRVIDGTFPKDTIITLVDYENCEVNGCPLFEDAFGKRNWCNWSKLREFMHV